MKEQDNSDEKLNSYFKLAGNEEPVVKADEVKSLLASRAGKPNLGNGTSTFQFGILLAILTVISGAIVLCFSAFNKDPIRPADNNPNHTASSLPKVVADSVSHLTGEGSRVADSDPMSIPPERSLTESATLSERHYFPGYADVVFVHEGLNVNMKVDQELLQLMINDSLIPPSDYHRYAEVIDKGLALKKESDKKLEGRSAKKENKKSKATMDRLIDELERDGLIQSGERFEFRLTGQQLFINGNAQKPALFEKYKNLYESSSGNSLNADSNILISH